MRLYAMSNSGLLKGGVGASFPWGAGKARQCATIGELVAWRLGARGLDEALSSDYHDSQPNPA